jgi:predicted ATPase
MGDNPTGTVTFLFTDIEGSTERWQRDGGLMAEALVAHDQLIRSAIERHGGVVFKHTGDGLCAVFVSSPSAVAAAVEAQSGLELPVRMGIHTGEAESRDGDYFGPTLNLAARVMDAGHGGQVLVSSATAGLVRDRVLVDLGEHRLKGLDGLERIFQVGERAFPSLRTMQVFVGNLPMELSSFVGRVDEVKSIVDELGEHRLVTLIGVGGTGKTRLSIEAARKVSESFRDGCWMVELAAVNVDEAVPFAFCTGVGIMAPAEGDVMGHLVARLRDTQKLIVVDNCEHLLAAAADVVEEIIRSCPDVVVLVTSREPLMIRGERLVPVPSLSPHEAERLFLERARDEAPDLAIDNDQARAVTELCARLDGLPLALELAASRVRAFSPVELVANLDERFRMLVGGRRSRMERHQTMRGTLDWSYELCSEVEQTVFDRLSVFPAGFDLAAARAVAGGNGVNEFDVVDVVAQLVDRSLLQRSTAADGTTRYRMLETMRAYGREHLQHQGIADTVRARHANHMATVISALGLRSLGPDEELVLRRIEEYLPDSLVALDWFIEHQDWEKALAVIFFGGPTTEREALAMVARLHQAAGAAGAPAHLLDQLATRDSGTLLTETAEQSVERGWRMIRTGPPISSDRLAFPPQMNFMDGGLTAETLDEYTDSLEAFRIAPPPVRFYGEWVATRSLIHNGYLDLADQRVAQLATLAAELDSVRATRYLDELRGSIARTRHDWDDAIHWYRKVVDDQPYPVRTWLGLAAVWHLLVARSLAADSDVIAGDDLCDPWRCYREEQFYNLLWHGATSTAVALHRLGRTGLADRFVAMAKMSDPGNIMEGIFADVLDAAGLPTAEVDANGNLDTLLDELFTVAAELDQKGD